MQGLRRPAGDLNYDVITSEAPPQAVPAGVVSLPVPRVVAGDMVLPSFFVIGPPRTGTSWLHHVLSSHTLLPSPAKETRFFDTHFQRGLKWYVAHFPSDRGNGKRRMGEVAPTYFASALARERIWQTVPNAKIICVFRNPVERIVSLYRVKRAYGLIPWTFEEALERDAELVETSRYASHLRLWQQAFGVGNVLAGIFDDLRENPQAFVDAVLDFIEVPRFALLGAQYVTVHDSENMTHPRSYDRTRRAMLAVEWLRARRMDQVVSLFKRSPMFKFVLGGGRPFPRLQAEVLRKLYEKFRPGVEELEVLLQRDLGRWKVQSSG